MRGVDKSADRVRRMFGQIARRYDLLNHLLSCNTDRYWRWRAARAVPLADGDFVLDVCTGTGDLALAFHRRSRGKAQVIGTDFCHPMLVIGARKGKRAAAQAIRWVEADSQQLPFPDNSFQIVSVAFGLRNIADTDRGLREMARVCRVGGTVLVLEFSLPTFPPLRAAYAAYFRHVLPRVGQLLARNQEEAYNYLPDSVGQFPQGQSLAAQMRRAGLEPVRWNSLTFGVASMYLGTKAPI
ncbi:MAG: bifunctional demethylmenaquinone methyltransferase/2-methoxy-6-polyprenyl-1,4-benzoquinol methylase UbiE [Planctomycetales bacterium]|nr:bifunctional demethylmenaquinone methyltransferase/2-methoxy-6-polyprenyl-1,4-benzoquinol methylase UbiE [Planctomycetales bacterium]NIM08285.1 bifunctional demethylmenaquinone methyltransferase/2-methoxy-6-polyprenyl-1,4-benzoquinol methylase UbiE [Planctomycetales bacterium]NIN07778.1 bifunctional demethylmenaquinone methyltransferase/2-methoxy-6-polyprenyl-1,4-benzoquinol methylase UbiE [Planctomycetales bacterium]NIN76898.1 bifunctional demethylmenaquinone methyltransferase/2-methoxy-6-po